MGYRTPLRSSCKSEVESAESSASTVKHFCSPLVPLISGSFQIMQLLLLGHGVPDFGLGSVPPLVIKVGTGVENELVISAHKLV